LGVAPIARLKTCLSILALIAQWSLGPLTALAHPGSGIVVDKAGNVYFNHTGRGVGKIDSHGMLTYVGETRGGHWLCLDAEGIFSRTQPKHFERITPDGVKPALIYADGGSPLAVLRDGALYFASNDEKGMTPGGLQVTRQSPSGEISIFPPDGKKITEKLGITGLAPGPDGSLYVASPSAVLKLKMDGTFITLVHPIELKDCDVDYPDNNPSSTLPSLRGLAVDEDGTVFAAGVGCRAVVKISPDGKNVETVLKAERPWSPTGVAVDRAGIYVLEYTNANGSPAEGWRPRVRKLGRDGKVTTLLTVALEQGKSERN
jgi:DNA-binding beta-propeller fold protein YncE